MAGSSDTEVAGQAKPEPPTGSEHCSGDSNRASYSTALVPLPGGATGGTGKPWAAKCSRSRAAASG